MATKRKGASGSQPLAIELLEAETNPLVARRRDGERGPSNQEFGRL